MDKTAKTSAGRWSEAQRSNPGPSEMGLRGPDTPKREAQVGDASGHLDHAIGNINGHVRGLVDRLDPVLRPGPPEGKSCGENTIDPARAPLAASMHRQASQLDELTQLVEDILGRLEV